MSEPLTLDARIARLRECAQQRRCLCHTEALAIIEELQRELAAAKERNSRSICVYCGEVQHLTNPESLRAEMAAHIVQCSKHPMNRIVALTGAIEILIDRTEKCPHCFDLGAALAKQVEAL